MSADRNSSFPLPIQNILNRKSSVLSGILSHLNRLSAIQQRLRDGLPAAIRPHVRVANFSDTTLTVHADSPAWAARLRFHIPDMLTVANDECDLPSVSTVRIKIKIPAEDSFSSARKFSLSGRSRNFLAKTAESSSDPDVSASLQRLAGH